MAAVLDFAAYKRLGEGDTDSAQFLAEHPLMIDWVTLSQVHTGGGLPRVNDGWMTSCDAFGAVEFETTKRSEIEGSFDSRMWLRCDGNRVEFHGNIARYGRRDNVFGYQWKETIRRVNELLNLYSLPPFTAGERNRYADSGWTWTGARVSRIDITKNHSAFNWKDAQQLLRILSQHHVGRQKGTLTPDASTVLYGYGSKYASGKCYLKAIELENNRRKKHGEHVGDDVIAFCKDAGVLREEFTLKSRFLTQSGLCWLGEITHQHLGEIYRARSQLRRLKEVSYMDDSELSNTALAELTRWEKGQAPKVKRSMFYRVRKEIIAARGVDISVPKSNVFQMPQRIKVIEVASLIAPDWYRKKYG